jgi:DNA integrity scanning protein DisA with diadenylate cyclase activity
MAPRLKTFEMVHGLYSDFFERGVRYFFPEEQLNAVGRAAESLPSLRFSGLSGSSLQLEWMGVQYELARADGAFSEDEMRLLGAIGAVLSSRYHGLFSPGSSASTLRLFEGLAEDRYVSSFLDGTRSTDEDGLSGGRDVVADAIQVLRQSSLITYENRRVSTGVILIGSGDDPYHTLPELPRGALPYTSALVSIKSFHRLCDGLHTVFLVDRSGMLLDLVDIEQFSTACSGAMLPAPTASRYRPHSLATLQGGHICLVLTPNGEIKVFARGAQVFQFLEGRWRLTDTAEKYHEFRRAVGEARLAERLFSVALDLAENRRGALFVLLDRSRSEDPLPHLIAPGDFLEDAAEATAKGQVHYLLRCKRVLELEPNVLQSIAQVDGGIVMDRGGWLLAFGAILRTGGEPMVALDGGRTTAALHASRFGLTLKVSEDGFISFYRAGELVWEM